MVFSLLVFITMPTSTYSPTTPLTASVTPFSLCQVSEHQSFRCLQNSPCFISSLLHQSLCCFTWLSLAFSAADPTMAPHPLLPTCTKVQQSCCSKQDAIN